MGILFVRIDVIDVWGIVRLIVRGLMVEWIIFIGIDGIFLVLIIEVKSIGILDIFVLFSGLGFASIAFFPEGEVEVVAVEADPVALACLIVRFG